MRVACIQMRSGINTGPNIEAASQLIHAAAQQGATFIATPEMTGLFQRRPNALFDAITHEADDPSLKAFQALSKSLNVHLLIGSLAILSGERRAVNRSFLIGPDGEILARYDKIHLFDAILSRAETYRESANYDSGGEAVCADIADAKLGMTICYDVRFAPLYKRLAMSGAQIIAVPSAFTVPTGQAHWEVLLRARAIETGSFIVAPAQGGPHEDGRETYGHSLIINPWGSVIGSLPHNDPGYVIADLDISEVTAARAKIPAWQDVTQYAGP